MGGEHWREDVAKPDWLGKVITGVLIAVLSALLVWSTKSLAALNSDMQEVKSSVTRIEATFEKRLDNQEGRLRAVEIAQGKVCPIPLK